MELILQMTSKMNKHLVQLLIGSTNETEVLLGIAKEFKETHIHLVDVLAPSSSNTNMGGSILWNFEWTISSCLVKIDRIPYLLLDRNFPFGTFSSCVLVYWSNHVQIPNSQSLVPFWIILVANEMVSSFLFFVEETRPMPHTCASLKTTGIWKWKSDEHSFDDSKRSPR